MNVLIYPAKPPPEFDIRVGGKRYHFEWHPYMGPVALKRNGDPAKAQPGPFLEAASLWNAHGRRMEDGLCRWDHEPKEILKHLGGRNWKIVGYHPAVRGE